MASAPAPLLFNATVRLLTLRQVSLWRMPAEPRAVGSLWLGAYLALKLASPDREMWYYDLARPLAQLGLAVVAGLFAAGLLRKAGDALRFVFAFLLITTAALLLQALFYALTLDYGIDAQVPRLLITAFGLILAVRFVWTASAWNQRGDKLRAALAAAVVLSAALAWTDGERALMIYAVQNEERPDLPDIDTEALWTAQPARLAAELAKLPEGSSPASRTFVIGVAAGGRQRIFGREVAKAGAALASRFGAEGRGAILSNSADDVIRLPMANRTNLAALLDEVGRRADPQRDLVVLYLASHGSRDGVLSTSLPDYTRLQPISADYLASALRHAAIGRRIVVVSACYSGSWIKPLASPDTIVLTASAADRTSFGCDDKRDTTEFGEAFIQSLGARGTTLRDAFEATRRDIDRSETAEERDHSLPQSHVGANMQALWTARD